MTALNKETLGGSLLYKKPKEKKLRDEFLVLK